VRNFDLFIAGSGVQLGVFAEGVLDALEPYLVLPEVKDPKLWFSGHVWVDNKSTSRFVYSFQASISQVGWYNTDLAKPEEIRSYDDFLHPKWKGKIGLHEPRRPGTGQSMWIYLWRVKGENYLKKLVDQGLFISEDLRQLTELLAKGRLAVALGPGDRVVAPFAQAGLPVKPIPIPKEGIQPAGGVGAVSVVKNPPHPNATKVFVNWLLSREGQEIFGKAVGQATRRLDVDTQWLQEIGMQAAKDVMPAEEYLRREIFLEDKLPLRKPAIELAEKILK
jgi:ABC-type Fe3+ transport system substrate-binding protein